ncbi:hypothetical protein BKA91DRAFT_136512 [Yarrowia lipolytica]|nr:hypothetical protein BKA91DRAFT_136512 [Yarrowia lipolytica]RMI94981.1 hypothetical protein BD777DRAFT_130595 [Yarrowia lipolytica]
MVNHMASMIIFHLLVTSSSSIFHGGHVLWQSRSGNSHLSLELIGSLLELAEKVRLVGSTAVGPRLGLGLVQHRSFLVAGGVLLGLIGGLGVSQIEEIQSLLGVERVDRCVRLRLRLRHCRC